MYVVGEFGESDFDEFFGCVHAVAGLEVLMVEFTLGDLHEEPDNASPVAGFFGDYLGESFAWCQVVVHFESLVTISKPNRKGFHPHPNLPPSRGKGLCLPLSLVSGDSFEIVS